MRVASKPKAIRNIVLSFAFLFLLLAVSIVAPDRSVIAVSITFAVVLGLPSLLLSIADLGRALKIEHGGNYRATVATRLFSHYRAAGGAICMSVAGYTLFRNVPALVNGTSPEPIALQLFWVVGGVALVFLGLSLIIRAFANESNDT